MEFATCKECNNQTSNADLAASFIARLHPTYSDPSTIAELKRLHRQIKMKMPDLAIELARPWKANEVWPLVNGIRQRMIAISADGPLVRKFLSVFCSKLAFALYREHIGSPLPLAGRAFTRWYLNAGLAQKDADVFLNKMPLGGELKQGSFTSEGQFYYRYNCDDREILTALAHFHKGIYVFLIVTSRPEYYLKEWQVAGPSDGFISPGGLGPMILQGSVAVPA